MASKSLHPQNSRVGTSGLPGPNPRPRLPAVYITEHGECKHETPLCPHVHGRPYKMVCREDALYALGERWCSTCRMHSISTDESGWTDPRYQRADGDSA